MIYTLNDLRDFTRSIDNRLEDKVLYPDSKIDTFIEDGIGLSQDIKNTLYYTKEGHNIEKLFNEDELQYIEIIPTREVHSIWEVEYDRNVFDISITPNNHILLKRKDMLLKPYSYNIIIRYFFYPTLPFTEIEMSVEVYRIVRHCISIVAYQFFRDKDSEQYHRSVVDIMTVRSTFDLAKELMEIPSGRFWRATWV